MYVLPTASPLVSAVAKDPAVRLSIIIPTHNRKEDLNCCLRSIRTQTGAAHEVIVVDDCSDESIHDVLVVEHYIRNESNSARRTRVIGLFCRPVAIC